MNWIALAETGFIDLDSVNLSVQIGCVTPSYCYDVITIDDLG